MGPTKRQIRTLAWTGGFAAASAGCLAGATPPGDTSARDDGGASLVAIATDGGTIISSTAYGQNYWDWVDFTDSGTTGLNGTAGPVTTLRLGLIRAGGNNNDSDSPERFDTSQIDAFVQYCRTVGAEPVLQVPLLSNNVDGGASTAESAAAMVTYANTTMSYGIRYWEIGNEPDLYAAQSSPAEHCARFAPYAAAMRAASGVPIQILGPEISQPKADWLTAFLQGCKDQVDVVTVHRYPFGPNTTQQAVFADNTKFESDITQMQRVVQQYARPGTPFGITESNESYQYNPTAYSAAELQIGPGSFTAGIWVADTMGTALTRGLWTLALWNIGETDRAGSVLGFLTGGQATPAYYAEELVSTSLRGVVLSPTGVPAGFSVYAAHDPGLASTSVIILNKTPTATPLALAIDDASYPAAVYPPESITLVTVPDGTDAGVHAVRYTADLADAGSAPASTN